MTCLIAAAVLATSAPVDLNDAAPAAESRRAREAFAETNRLYRRAADAEGEERVRLYRQAARRYAALAVVRRHEPNGYVLYNLGNARYRLGEFGRAIAAYRRAEDLLPRHAPTQRNLAIAREKALGGGPGRRPHPAAAAFFFWHYALSLAEAEAAAALFFLVFAGVMTARLFTSHLGGGVWLRRLKAPAVASAVLAGAFALSSMAKLAPRSGGGRAWDSSGDAVVVAAETRVRSEPAGRAVELFTLREGAEVRVLRRSGDGWTRVSAGPDRRGWVETRSLELLSELLLTTEARRHGERPL